uniref:Uncharacterized protein n=1 Tax=Brassica campestris TaxID=3711 RepID=M4DXR8_BRACM
MAGDTNNMSGRNPRDCSSQKRMRSSNDSSTRSNKSSNLRQSGENTNTPQTNEKRSGLLPLKRVFSTVLGDVTNKVRSTPTELQSGVLNHIESVQRQTESSRGLQSQTFLLINDVFIALADYIMAITVFWFDFTVNLRNSSRLSNKKNQPNLNNSGLTSLSYEGHSSRNDSITSNKRRCADIRPTNLFKAFSIAESTEKHTATTSSPRGQQGFLDETNIEDDSENLCPFEGIIVYYYDYELYSKLFTTNLIGVDQGFQIYDISSEEEDTNYEDHSDSETTTLPQEEISVQTVQDDHSAQVLKMATIFQNIFEDKPLKKGWTKSKRPGKAFKKNCVLAWS